MPLPRSASHSQIWTAAEMSWLGRLFGRGSSGSAEPGPAAPTGEVEHNGFTIQATPYRSEGGQFQTAGTILKTVDGAERRHDFVRADRFASIEDATALSLQKGRQLVDEQGERMFAPKPGLPADPS